MASEPARTRLLWDILSLVLPVTFGHTTACRGPALTFSACSGPASTLFLAPPRSPRPPPVLRGSRTSAVSCPPCAPKISRTGSTCYAVIQRCPDRKSGGRCDNCSLANRCSESGGTCGGLGAACHSSTRAGSTWRNHTASSRVPRVLASRF